MDDATIIVLNVGNSRTIHLLPADGEDAVAEWNDLNIHDLGPSESPFLDLEPQLRMGKQRQTHLKVRIRDVHFQSNRKAIYRHLHDFHSVMDDPAEPTAGASDGDGLQDIGDDEGR